MDKNTALIFAVVIVLVVLAAFEGSGSIAQFVVNRSGNGNIASAAVDQKTDSAIASAEPVTPEGVADNSGVETAVPTMSVNSPVPVKRTPRNLHAVE